MATCGLRRATNLRREGRLGEPNEYSHGQEDQPQQVEDLVEADLLGKWNAGSG